MSTDGLMSASASSSPVTVQPPPSYFYSKKKKSRVSADKLNSTVISKSCSPMSSNVGLNVPVLTVDCLPSQKRKVGNLHHRQWSI